MGFLRWFRNTDIRQLVTGADAAEYLSRNNPLVTGFNEYRVMFYQARLSEGELQHFTNPIVFRGDVLVDGTHRLHAIVRENASIELTLRTLAGRTSIRAMRKAGYNDLAYAITKKRDWYGTPTLPISNHVYCRNKKDDWYGSSAYDPR